MKAWEFWLGIAGSVVIITGGLFRFTQIINKIIAKSVAEQLKPVQDQVTNNGGSSMKDAIDRIEKEVTRQGKEIDTLSLQFQRHLGYHEGQVASLHS